MNPDTIQALDTVLIHLPSGNAKLMKVQAGKTCDLGKFGNFPFEWLIGTYYGVYYESNRDGLVKSSKDFLMDFENELETDERNNNSGIFADSNNQQLTADEIEEMKKQVNAGDLSHSQVIKKIVENSQSFEQKTEFAKLKYIRKKQKKFSRVFKCTKPTAHNQCEFWFDKNPDKIMEMRTDTLAQLLTQSNVHHGSRLLVVDETGGLILLGLLERLGGKGELAALYANASPSFEIAWESHKTADANKLVSPVKWMDVGKEFTPIMKATTEEEIAKAMIKVEKSRERHETFSRGGYHGLVIATHFSPVGMLEKLSSYLDSSVPVVIYAPRIELLLEAHEYMLKSPEYVNTRLSESWMREYQVSVGTTAGTHPHMTTSGSGGYLLTSTRVIKTEADIERRPLKKSKKEKESE
ncbi:Gcd10p family-domain-containing protein [Gorgonomyces haynaldii]|nr:Gcd10p family-domain-containing protein [Gorgonomyces haynaldii]